MIACTVMTYSMVGINKTLHPNLSTKCTYYVHVILANPNLSIKWLTANQIAMTKNH